VNAGELKQAVIGALTGVAPDIEPDSINPAAEFRRQFDFDSMDFLNFVTALHQRFGIDIPEGDYPKLQTLDGCIDYLSRPASGK
jgi:acyl carrier protein